MANNTEKDGEKNVKRNGERNGCLNLNKETNYERVPQK